MNRERILGIDPGSLKTGFGIIEKWHGESAKHISHGTIFLESDKNIADRIHDLSHDLTALIKKYEPQVAAVEDVFFCKNARSALILGQARGAILAVLGIHHIKTYTLSPTAIKSLIVGHGRAQKSQVAAMVALELNIEVPRSGDASDALALALALSHYKKSSPSL